MLDYENRQVPEDIRYTALDLPGVVYNELTHASTISTLQETSEGEEDDDYGDEEEDAEGDEETGEEDADEEEDVDDEDDEEEGEDA